MERLFPPTISFNGTKVDHMTYGGHDHLSEKEIIERHLQRVARRQRHKLLLRLGLRSIRRGLRRLRTRRSR